MRKNKGYQKDIHKVSWRTKKQSNSYASGENKSLEQCLKEIDENFDWRIKHAKNSYAFIAKKTTLEGKDLINHCHDLMMWEIKFDDDNNLIPLEEVLKDIEKQRERYKAWKTYKYTKRVVNKDNQKFVYNSGSGSDGNYSRSRIPSMKRSNSVWKRFYELFPSYKEHFDEINNKNGVKLKKVW